MAGKSGAKRRLRAGIRAPSQFGGNFDTECRHEVEEFRAGSEEVGIDVGQQHGMVLSLGIFNGHYHEVDGVGEYSRVRDLDILRSSTSRGQERDSKFRGRYRCEGG